MTNENDKLEGARKQGQAQFDSIREMVAALNCDYARLEELREERAGIAYDIENAENDEERALFQSNLENWDSENGEELKELEDAAGDCKDEDEARERIQEDALSVEVRSDWYAPGDKDGASPSHFRILLCTGGPAVQITGKLNEHCEPSRAWMQVQNWFTPWTDFFPKGEDVGETLLAYARCFYFGE